jgi:hypothetical protein
VSVSVSVNVNVNVNVDVNVNVTVSVTPFPSVFENVFRVRVYLEDRHDWIEVLAVWACGRSGGVY